MSEVFDRLAFLKPIINAFVTSQINSCQHWKLIKSSSAYRFDFVLACKRSDYFQCLLIKVCRNFKLTEIDENQINDSFKGVN